jgi:hypothetical protein
MEMTVNVKEAETTVTPQIAEIIRETFRGLSHEDAKEIDDALLTIVGIFSHLPKDSAVAQVLNAIDEIAHEDHLKSGRYETWGNIERNAPAAPTPPPADTGAGAGTTPSDEIIGVLDAISDAEHHHEDCAPAVSQYEKLDGKTNLTLDALRALTLLVDSLQYDIRILKAQKGERTS